MWDPRLPLSLQTWGRTGPFLRGSCLGNYLLSSFKSRGWIFVGKNRPLGSGWSRAPWKCRGALWRGLPSLLSPGPPQQPPRKCSRLPVHRWEVEA